LLVGGAAVHGRLYSLCVANLPERAGALPGVKRR
jgi:hypothetical protein